MGNSLQGFPKGYKEFSIVNHCTDCHSKFPIGIPYRKFPIEIPYKEFHMRIPYKESIWGIPYITVCKPGGGGITFYKN